MKIKRKHISICSVCEGNGYVLEDHSDFGQEVLVPRWCSSCNGHGYILRKDKQEELKAIALSIFEEIE